MRTVIENTEHEMIRDQLRTYIRSSGLTESQVYAEMSERLGRTCGTPENNKQWWRRELGVNADENRKNKKLRWQQIVKVLPKEIKKRVVNVINAECDLNDIQDGCYHEDQDQIFTLRANADRAFHSLMFSGESVNKLNILRDQKILMQDTISAQIAKISNVIHQAGRG